MQTTAADARNPSTCGGPSRTSFRVEWFGFQVENCGLDEDGLLHAAMVISMEPVLKVARLWGAPVAALVFFALWCVAEAGRMGVSWVTWSGLWPLILTALAIGTAVWKPLASLGFTAALLLAQVSFVVPPMADTHWAIYLGSFVALGFIVWSATPREKYIAGGANLVFLAAMTVLILSWRYSGGVGWFLPLYLGDRPMFMRYGWQLFALLLVIAAACAAMGLLLAMYQERGNLFRARELAQDSLMKTEVDLIVEQERTRISRDLHDVLAHSLAVIAAQADGTRYLSNDQPKAVLNALDTIAKSARSALLDAQRVIEGVRDDRLAAPQPQLKDVALLVEEMQHGKSLEVHSSESGTPAELSTGQQVAVFRIVQECLTNALKHGGRGTVVRLHFDWNGPGLTLHIASELSPNSRTGSEPASPRSGRGLPGMRERAQLAGGWLAAGPDGEHFRVTVFIPYGTPGPLPTETTGDAQTDAIFAVPPGAEPRAGIAVSNHAQPALTAKADQRG